MPSTTKKKNINTREKIGRLDADYELRKKVLPLCRLNMGEIWEDEIRGHKVGVLDATNLSDLQKIMGSEKTKLIVNDPPYNISVGNNNKGNLSKIRLNHYIDFSKKWVKNALSILDKDSHFYIWLGADYKDNFQPLPDFMIMMRDFHNLSPRNFITILLLCVLYYDFNRSTILEFKTIFGAVLTYNHSSPPEVPLLLPFCQLLHE